MFLLWIFLSYTCENLNVCCANHTGCYDKPLIFRAKQNVRIFDIHCDLDLADPDHAGDNADHSTASPAAVAVQEKRAGPGPAAEDLREGGGGGESAAAGPLWRCGSPGFQLLSSTQRRRLSLRLSSLLDGRNCSRDSFSTIDAVRGGCGGLWGLSRSVLEYH